MKKILSMVMAFGFTSSLAFASTKAVDYSKKCQDQFNNVTNDVAVMAENRVSELEEGSHAVTWARELTETGDEIVALKKAIKIYCLRMKGLN